MGLKRWMRKLANRAGRTPNRLGRVLFGNTTGILPNVFGRSAWAASRILALGGARGGDAAIGKQLREEGFHVFRALYSAEVVSRVRGRYLDRKSVV